MAEGRPDPVSLLFRYYALGHSAVFRGVPPSRAITDLAR